ncbi:MAG: hypothetical protein ACLQVL_07495 [Terriglobia bacterium]
MGRMRPFSAWTGETRSADRRVCGLRLFVDERYSMGRRAHGQGRDADHKNGGPRLLISESAIFYSA